MILKKLIKGHQNFQRNEIHKWEEELKEMSISGQKPEILFIGCSDSRVAPDLMLNTKPGDMFLIRNVGNFIPPFKHDADYHGTAAAIEYAVSVLKVKHIVVCGHTHCGACKSLYSEIPDSDSLVHVKTWLNLGNEAKEITLKENQFKSEDEMFRITEKNSVQIQTQRLLTYPDVKRRFDNNELELHAWIYNVENGDIDYLEHETKEFKPLKDMKIED